LTLNIEKKNVIIPYLNKRTNKISNKIRRGRTKISIKKLEG